MGERMSILTLQCETVISFASLRTVRCEIYTYLRGERDDVRAFASLTGCGSGARKYLSTSTIASDNMPTST